MNGQDTAWMNVPSRQGEGEIEDSLPPTFVLRIAQDDDISTLYLRFPFFFFISDVQQIPFIIDLRKI